MKRILVTGGAGYIGSHVIVELAAAGFEPVIIDNLANAAAVSVKRLEGLAGRRIPFYEAPYQDAAALRDVITTEQIDGIIHIAAFKAVGESVEEPLKYYRNNVSGFVTLLETALAAGIKYCVFSSSAAVYGTPPTQLVTEETPCAPESPYGWSKYMDEIILQGTCAANPEFHGVALRYFNVVGSHPSAAIGESPKGKPQNLLPIIVRAVATGQPFTVYGTNYPTPDGTCLRDYIHVVDLARAHVAALRNIMGRPGGYDVYNVGTGRPTSVLELIAAFERANGVKVPHHLGERRPGDPVAAYASARKAEAALGWHAALTVDDAVRSAWQWQQRAA